MTEELVYLKKEELKELMQTKLEKAGLQETHAKEVANHLTYADLRGVHSHGAVRVEYYSERIAKGGTTVTPDFKFEKTGPSTGVFHADNAIGHVAAKEALSYGMEMAKETGVGIVGVSKMGHSGMLSYYVDIAAQNDLVALAVCQSDPMAVPFGGTEPFFGTNPIAFSAPTNNERPIIFDMATTVQAWGKILDARSKNLPIPNTWAVDKQGEPTTDANQVNGLLPISGPKGYGLMMMVDVLSGSLLGLPFGKHVTSMYSDLSTGRNLGQLFILINPSYFTDLEAFKENLSEMIKELHENQPATGFEQVYYPGELSEIKQAENEANGIPVAQSIYDYLLSNEVHYNRYDHSDAFAEK
ncbi:ureidoglycolate dehydrogenase [uncultured Vagococcus sp.]|uniref:ureidoglycolate dehydrogenase n=1 Tax=uncultured Vagococcus sp. TaxID=189676 RepID=UPI00258A05CF|nr:ureidoglycolate dehydrogenase [uncultured Vagococcus sp.]